MNQNIFPYRNRDEWLQVRAAPRVRKQRPSVKRDRVSLASLSRYIELSRPRITRAKFDGDAEQTYVISERAINFEATERLKQLAMPRRMKNVSDHFTQYSQFLYLFGRP